MMFIRNTQWGVMLTNLVVMDVTRMAKPRVCVAGLTLEGDDCIRPLLKAGDLDEAWLRHDPEHLCEPFTVIGVELLDQPKLEPPHVEDWHIAPNYVFVRHLEPDERDDLLRRTAVTSVSQLFGTPLDLGGGTPCVSPGTGTRSLATLKPKAILGVRLDRFPGRPLSCRLELVDAEGVVVSAAVTDLRFRLAVERTLATTDGLSPTQLANSLTRQLHGADVWLRVGLSRRFSRDGSAAPRCYLQVNGVHTIPDDLGNGTLADELAWAPQ